MRPKPLILLVAPERKCDPALVLSQRLLDPARVILWDVAPLRMALSFRYRVLLVHTALEAVEVLNATPELRAVLTTAPGNLVMDVLMSERSHLHRPPVLLIGCSEELAHGTRADVSVPAGPEFMSRVKEKLLVVTARKRGPKKQLALPVAEEVAA